MSGVNNSGHVSYYTKEDSVVDDRRVMKMVDGATNLMECRVCKVQHYAVRSSNGRLKPGSWRCDDGCVLPGDGRGVLREKDGPSAYDRWPGRG